MIPRLIHASLLLIFAVERPNSSRKLRGRRVLCEASLTKRHCHDGVANVAAVASSAGLRNFRVLPPKQVMSEAVGQRCTSGAKAMRACVRAFSVLCM